MSEEMDNGLDILTLVDEDGIEHLFEIVGHYDDDDESYVALIPIFDDGEEMLDDDAELVLLKVRRDAEEEYLEPIEDEEEFDRISAYFIEQLKDEFDFDSAE